MATRMHLFMAAHEKWSQSSKLLRPYDETAHHDAFAAAASAEPVCPPATHCCRRRRLFPASYRYTYYVVRTIQHILL